MLHLLSITVDPVGSISHSVVMLEFEARFIVDSGFAQRDSGLFVPGREL